MAEYAITWSPLDDLFPSQELVYRWLHAFIQHCPVHRHMPVSNRIRPLSLLRSRHYTRNSFAFDEVVALYLASDVMVVTPVSDGMNLVAKEYVASRTDDTGVLILSEFAGAARELDSALIVNPYDREEMKDVLIRAATMEPAEQRERMSRMRRQVGRFDIHHWVSSFVKALRQPVR